MVPSRIDVLLLLLALLIPVDALAYLDPGSGSMFLQLVLAGLFSALFFLKSFFRRLFSSLVGLFRKSPPVASLQPEGAPNRVAASFERLAQAEP